MLEEKLINKKKNFWDSTTNCYTNKQNIHCDTAKSNDKTAALSDFIEKNC